MLIPAVNYAMAVIVWIVAVADRILEAQHRRSTWRHWFAWRFRRPLIVAISLATMLGIWMLMYQVPESIVSLGRFLGIPLAFYLMCARGEGGLRMAIPREIARGAMFSAGVLLPTFGIASVPPTTMEIMVAQTLLVSLIFLGVCARELPHVGQDEWKPIDHRLPLWLIVLLGTLVWLATTSLGSTGSSMSYYYMAMTLSGTVFLFGYLRRKVMSSDGLHALAWASLTLPMLALPFLQLNQKYQTAFAPHGPFDQQRAAGLEDRVRLNDGLFVVPKL